MKGEWTEGTVYNKLWQVTDRGSTFQSKVNNNSTRPTTIGTDGKVVLIHKDLWLCIADGTPAKNAAADIAVVKQQWAEEKADIDQRQKALEESVDENIKVNNQVTQSNINANNQATEDAVKKAEQAAEQANEAQTNADKAAAAATKSVEDINAAIAAGTGGAVGTATNVVFDNSDTGLEGQNVQSALSETAKKLKVDETEEGGTNVNDVLKIISNSEYMFAVIDADKNVLGGYKWSGEVYVAQGMPEACKVLFASLQKQITENKEFVDSAMRIVEDDNWLLAIIDEDNNVMLGLDRKGELYAPKGMPEDTKTALKELWAYVKAKDSSDDERMTKAETLADERHKALEEKLRVVEGQNFLAALIDAANNRLITVNENGDYVIAKDFFSDNGFSLRAMDTGTKALFAFVDKVGNLLAQIGDDGKLYAATGVTIGDWQSGIKVVDTNSEWLFGILDANNNVLAAIDEKGGLFCNSLRGALKAEVVDNDEWLFVLEDCNGNIACGIKRDMTFYAPKVEVPGMAKEGEDAEFLYVILDAEKKVLGGIWWNGEWYMPKGIPEEQKAVNKAVDKKLENLSSEIEYVKTHGKDWSDSKTLHLPIPMVPAKVEITGTIPSNKYNQTYGTLKYSDYLGNSFTKEIMWNVQGNISAGFDKKNFAIDLYNSVKDDESFDIGFGSWVKQDGYHLKAYTSDFWKVRSLAVYRHMELISKSRPYYKRYPYCQLMGTYSQTDDEVLKGGSGSINDDILTGAMCHPDGFPVLLYINGTPWGLYTWNLKKSKENYNIAKNDNDALQMCFGDSMNQVFERFDSIHWKITNQNLTDTTGVEKWDETKDYAIGDVCYDEETFDYEVNGKTSSVTIRRKFEAVAASGPSTHDLYHVSTRPSQVGWRRLEMRNPKKTICREVSYDADGNKQYSYAYYDYDSPGDFSTTQEYERTHEIISGDEITQKQATALGFSKKEYNRSVNVRKHIEEYSKCIPIIRSSLTVQNLLDWGFVEEFDATKEYAIGDVVSKDLTLYKFTAAHAAGEWTGTDATTTSGSTVYKNCRKAIFDEHHDVDFNIDHFLVMNLDNWYDSITHNTIYTMYDGKHLVANVYDTDISLGMSSTYTNSFPSVSTGLITGECFSYLWEYHADDIKARWKELRDNSVLTEDVLEGLVWDVVNQIGNAAYEEELTTWPDQSSFRNPVYWRMSAGGIKILTDEDGNQYHGYDESLNSEKEGAPTWDADTQFAMGDVVNLNGHSYTATATPLKGVSPEDSYTCGSPTSGGVLDSPRRIIVWWKKRLSIMDGKMSYTAA